MLGEKIRTLRQQRGLNIDQMAAELDLTQSTLGKYERGEREPDYSTIIKIADYLNVSIDWLLGRVDNPSEYSSTDLDVNALLKYYSIIDRARKHYMGSIDGSISDDLFCELLDISIKYGLNSAIEIMKLNKK